MTKPTESTEARDLRTLLQTVIDALTLPYTTPDYDRRIIARAEYARTVADAALTEAPADLAWNTDYLRRKLASEQHAAEKADRAAVAARFLTNEHTGQAQAANRCARCHWTFDPHDKRHDGHARHRESPYCRRCTTNCHNGGADHACVICNPTRYGGTQ